MKKIEAIVRPEQLEPLKDALLKAKINGITINQVFGCGNQFGWTEYHRGSEVIMNTLPKVEFKIVVSDDRVEEIIGIIMESSQTGEMGDGKIFITEVIDCIRIRSGERGIDAI
ncbi:P-II family nitrogen regulator [Anaerosacchariphilus polymeriproducens]|uniref:P-II family nitrogen regulator n=1 Tax=Anaerosacchariphilus polymeriproducens TaxID=1812858 RepID=A0A371AY62_9FIRM|nr:P-II family nitrogen regulator [Anaerosacchariphilus polymeriproducens]RDU24524.1 P-II family nitrogen regulator [Anaerosacchariphilus polymeriproducens]